MLRVFYHRALLSKKIYLDLFLSTFFLALVVMVANYFFGLKIDLTVAIVLLVLHGLMTFLIYYFDVVRYQKPSEK